jgi:hypothetical protein
VSARPLTLEEREVLTDAEADEWFAYRRLVDSEFRRAAGTALGALLRIASGEIVHAPKEEAWKRLLVPASEIRERPVRWLWRERIPRRTTTIFTGLGGIGKSQVLIGITGEATRGELTGRPERVLYFSAEDDPESVLIPRMNAAGVDRDLVYVMKVGRNFLLRERDFGTLEGAIAQLQPLFVVFDPLVAYLDRGTDSWKTQDVRLVLRQLQDVASAHDATFLAVIHFKKGQERDVLHRISGAAGFGDACRSALAAAEHPDGEGFALVHVKSNYGRKQPTLRYRTEEMSWESAEGELIRTSRVSFDGDDPTLTEDVVFGKKPGPGRDAAKVAEAVEFLGSWLGDGETVPAGEIEKAADEAMVGRRALDEAKTKLGVRSAPVKDDRGRVKHWVWTRRGEVEF